MSKTGQSNTSQEGGGGSGCIVMAMGSLPWPGDLREHILYATLVKGCVHPSHQWDFQTWGMVNIVSEGRQHEKTFWSDHCWRAIVIFPADQEQGNLLCIGPNAMKPSTKKKSQQ